MGRKNRNAARARLSRKGEGRIPQLPVRRVAIDELIIPDGQCTFRTRKPKARFSTKAKAETALSQARRQRERIGSGHVEKRVYQCPEGGCGGFHLTSRESYDENAWSARRGESS